MNLTLSNNFLNKLGTLVSVKVREHTNSGKDVDNGTFDQYTSSYATRKAAGKIKRQTSTQTNPPDLTLSSDMLRDLQVRGTGVNKVLIGWAGVFAQRVAQNESRGRIISKVNKVFTTEITDLVERQFRNELDRLTRKDNSTEIVKIRL